MADENKAHAVGFQISVDGDEITKDEAGTAAVNLIRVDMVSDGPDYFEIGLYSHEAEIGKSGYCFPFKDVYQIGADIEIGIGYGSEIVNVFKGQITRMDGNFSSSDPPVFVVAGFDRLHLLTRGRVTQHWQDVKYSDVASDIASKCGLSGDAEDTTTQFDYISMNNQTYLSFLTDLARRVGYEVNVDDKTLQFKKERSDQGSVATLKFGENLNKVKVRVQSAGQVTKVRVLSWDEKAKEQIIGESDSVSESLGATTTGPEVADAEFGEAEYWISNYTANCQAEVDTAATSIMDEIAHRFANLEAECEGNPDIRPGVVVTIEGCTEPFNGDYYVKQAIHQWDTKRDGYTTRFVCSRPGYGL